MLDNNYPFSAFSGSLHTLLLRFVQYFLVVLAGMGLGSGVVFLLSVQQSDPTSIVLWPFLVPALIVGGFAQGWGMFSYGFLFGFGLLYMTTEMRARWLWLAFIIQAIEAFRCMAVWAS